MKKGMKIFVVICAVLVVLFLLCCLLSYLFGAPVVTNTHEPTEEFSNISIEAETADIKILPSEDGKCKVVCYERENQSHCVTVENDTLTIKLVDTRKWYEYIGFNFVNTEITVYLPEPEYGALAVNNSTGDITVADDFKFKSIAVSVSTGAVDCRASANDFIKVTASTGDVNLKNVSSSSINVSTSTGNITVSNADVSGEVKIKVSTGKTTLNDISCKSFSSNGSTGDIFLNKLIVENKLSVERSTGDVKFNACDASEIFVKVSTGDVEGSLLTGKTFVTNAGTGRVNVPSSTVGGGRCEIKTGTGNINISVRGN